MSYIECPQCGQKALSVATRCPRCGYNYPPQPIHRHTSGSELARLRPLLPIAGIIVAGVVLVVVIAQWVGSGRLATPSTGAPTDTAASVAPAAEGALEAEPNPSPSAAAAAAGNDTAAVAPAAPAPSGEGLRRYARTWVNVRGGRARSTPAVKVLNPGQAVTVDSLRRGWYRVLIGGRALGYVHRSMLDAAPPPRRP